MFPFLCNKEMIFFWIFFCHLSRFDPYLMRVLLQKQESWLRGIPHAEMGIIAPLDREQV